MPRGPKNSGNRQQHMFGEDGKPAVRFIQIISVSYTYKDGEGEGSSVVALGDDGIVYQYRRGDIQAWVPFNTDILTPARR
jgi:hypothetical protein